MPPTKSTAISAKEQAKYGLPDGFNVFSAAPFGTMNQQDSRVGIPDNELYFRENFIKTGASRLRTLWDKGASIYTAASGKTIVSFFFFNIAATQYAAVFLNDGTADQVQVSNGAVTHMSTTPNTFYQSGYPLPACVQSGSQYLLVANNNTPNSYWIWDGSILYSAGSLSPVIDITNGGSGYSSAPTVAAFGGSGSGWAGTAAVADGAVVSITTTNPGTGYRPGDIVQFAFSGGGSDNSAILEAVLSGATVGHIELLAGGTGYTSAPTISFINGGGHASATASISAGGVSGIAVVTGGDYGSTPTVIISGGGGSGATATATLTGTAITSFTVTNPGTGYTSAPTVSFLGGGQAAATATISGGTISSIDLTNNGSNFTGTPAVVITGGGGSGAQALAILNPGSVASVSVIYGGSGFTSTPTLTFVGGGGTGATATVSLTSQVITSVTVTNGGSDYTSAPAVEVESGVNNAAAATAELMPFGVSGSSIETFTSSVYLGYPNQQGSQNNGGKFLQSAPGSLTDFATSDGGVIYTSTDRFLRAQYVNFRQSNGYLYPLGDSSTSVISNVQTSGSPAETTFNYQNTDPQVGTGWRDSCQDYGRTVLFANELGVFGLYGGAVTKVSAKLDSLFAAAYNPNAPLANQVIPSAAVANIYSLKVYLLLLTFRDPVQQAQRTAMVAWDEKDWFIVSQSFTPTYIGTQEVNSNLTAWGTDGINIYPMMQTPNASLLKRITTKLYGVQKNYLTKEALAVIVQGDDHSPNQAGFSFAASVLTEMSSYPIMGGATVSYQAPTPMCPVAVMPSGDVIANTLGLDFTTTAPDIAVYDLKIAYKDQVGGYGSSPLFAPVTTEAA